MRFIVPITTAGERIRDIEKAIKEEKYDIAENVLNLFKQEIDQGARVYDVLDHNPRWNKLNAMLQREKRITQFSKAVEQYTLEEATKTLAELVDQKLISKKEQEELNGRVYLISEEGLLEHIKANERLARRNLSEKFLEVYPSSKEKRRVIEDLIVGRFSDLTNAPEQKLSSDELYETAHDLTKLLQKYSDEELDLSTVVNVDELNNSINEYLKILKHKSNGKGEVKIGGFVKFVTNEERTFGSLNWGYIYERESKIPKGSVGKLIKKDGWEHLVEFEGIHIGAWKDSLWSSMKAYISAGENNVVIFEKTELQPVEPANEIDKNHVRLELNRIKELFQEHYTGKQEPVKKRHNPEVIDKVLPRSD